MTKETKIGLLVGLAFIIVIGILLSDHIQSATEPPRAQLASSGTTARRAIETPGVGAEEVAVAAPTKPIPTADELKQAPAPQTVIKIRPADSAVADDSRVVINKVPDNTVPTLSGVANTDAPLITHLPGPAGSGDEGAQTPIVSPTPIGVVSALNTIPTFPGVIPAAAPAASPVKVAMKPYVALKGDSLSKIAAKFYNDRSPAMIKLIVDANKDLKADPRNLLAGKTYMIPANPKGDVTTLAAARTTPTTMPSRTVVAGGATTPPASTPKAVATVLYTVKDGDNLWKIATEEAGSAKAVQQIRDLNKDVLKGTDNVKANMKLKVPARVMATAN